MIIQNTFDLLFSTIYLAFLITFAHRVFSLILPKFIPVIPKVGIGTQNSKISSNNINNGEDYKGIFNKSTFIPLLFALLVSTIIFGIGGGISKLLANISEKVVVVFTITTLGIVASLNPKIHKIEKTFELGMYFILFFVWWLHLWPI